MQMSKMYSSMNRMTMTTLMTKLIALAILTTTGSVNSDKVKITFLKTRLPLFHLGHVRISYNTHTLFFTILCPSNKLSLSTIINRVNSMQYF